MARVAVLHPGEMGSAVGAALVATGQDVVWLPEGRSEVTARRAEEAGLTPAADVRGCDVVLSVCPPGAAPDVARLTAGFTGIFLEANAICPATAQAVAHIVESGGAAYVDGGIIGSPPRQPGTTRLYLSGSRAVDVHDLFHGTVMETRVLTKGGPFAASAVKMAFASWTKISAAVLLAADETATVLGVAQALHDEWALSQPELAERLSAARRSAESKGWRWEAEMREIAKTFADVGQPIGFGEAAADVFSRYERPQSRR
jgi:3-hydroxyisobutyrate dehydrogenase-like beta-hydroxyacid dehydrogenase